MAYFVVLVALDVANRSCLVALSVGYILSDFGPDVACHVFSLASCMAQSVFSLVLSTACFFVDPDGSLPLGMASSLCVSHLLWALGSRVGIANTGCLDEGGCWRWRLAS